MEQICTVIKSKLSSYSGEKFVLLKIRYKYGPWQIRLLVTNLYLVGVFLTLRLTHSRSCHYRLFDHESHNFLNDLFLSLFLIYLQGTFTLGFFLFHIDAFHAVDVLNGDEKYFGNSEFAIRLQIRNLTCSQNVVLNDFFNFLTVNPNNESILGVIRK